MESYTEGTGKILSMQFSLASTFLNLFFFSKIDNKVMVISVKIFHFCPQRPLKYVDQKRDLKKKLLPTFISAQLLQFFSLFSGSIMTT